MPLIFFFFFIVLASISKECWIDIVILEWVLSTFLCIRWWFLFFRLRKYRSILDRKLYVYFSSFLMALPLSYMAYHISLVKITIINSSYIGNSSNVSTVLIALGWDRGVHFFFFLRGSLSHMQIVINKNKLVFILFSNLKFSCSIRFNFFLFFLKISRNSFRILCNSVPFFWYYF